MYFHLIAWLVRNNYSQRPLQKATVNTALVGQRSVQDYFSESQGLQLHGLVLLLF